MAFLTRKFHSGSRSVVSNCTISLKFNQSTIIDQILIVQILFYFYFFLILKRISKLLSRVMKQRGQKTWLSLRSIVIRCLLSTVLAIPSWGPRATFLKSDTRSRATGSTPTKPQKTWKEDAFERLLS